MSNSQQQKIEFNRVYKRLERAERAKTKDNNISPSIEIFGDTTVSIYASNLPICVNEFKYQSPIDNSEIITKMTLTDEGLEPGFHDACICTNWIAFIADDPLNPPCIYDCGLIDWEFVFRQDNPNC